MIAKDRVYGKRALRHRGAGTIAEVRDMATYLVEWDSGADPELVDWLDVSPMPNASYVLSDHDRRVIALGMVDCEGNPIDEAWVRIANMNSLQMVAEGIVTVERIDR